MSSFTPIPPAKRCLSCYYVLDNLPDSRCPECGRAFNPLDPRTYTLKPPFIWWRYWLPPFLLASLVGIFLFAFLITTYGYSVSVTLSVPFAIGALAGYAGRKFGKIALLLLAALAFATAIGGLIAGGFLGIFCALALFAVGLVPAFAGALAGYFLRQAMKKTSFSQRPHLPLFFLTLFPVVLASAEGRHTSLPLTTIQTSQILDVPPDQAWHAILFYEEVHHTPPLLLRIPTMWKPLYTRGHSEKPGDIKICVYTTGRLVKRITSVDPNHRLTFEVLQQQKIETDAVRLLSGSFEFTPTPDGQHTRVTLSTTYQPLLAPRFAWLPFESLAVQALHGHVLKGMSLKATADRPTTQPTP